jgi:hypothetical protein
MRTPKVEDVKHRWVHLDKLVVKILLELRPGEYEEYVLKDGTMIVELQTISYGLVEAAHYWYKNLEATFNKHDYKTCMKDKCVFVKKVDNKVAYCATTVDDCFFVTTNDEECINKQIEMLRETYEAVDIEHGDQFGLAGMHVKMNRVNK